MSRRDMSERSWSARLRTYRALFDDGLREADLLPHFLEVLSHDFPGTFALLTYDANMRLTNEQAWWRLDESFIRAYSQHYYGLNPFPEIVRRNRLFDTTAVLSHWMDNQTFSRGEFFNDLMRPRGERYLAGISVSYDDGGRTGLAFSRGEAEGGDYSREDARRIDMLRPILKQALTMRRLFYRPATLADAGTARTRPLLQPELIFNRHYGLSPREAQVAALLARGCSYREAGFRLGITYHTVNAHVKALLRRLNLSSTRRLAALLDR